MSLHLTYDVKERHWPLPRLPRFLTGILSKVGGERFALGQTGGRWVRRRRRGRLMVRSERPVNNFFRGDFGEPKSAKSRHRNDCLPTLTVGQATAAVAVAFDVSPERPVGRERPSMGVGRPVQEVFCGNAKFSVRSLDESIRGPVAPMEGAGESVRLWPLLRCGGRSSGTAPQLAI